MSLVVQNLVVAALVLIAAVVVIRRLAQEIRGFRSAPKRRARGPSAPQPAKLIQIQTRPPIHMRRPPRDDS